MQTWNNFKKHVLCCWNDFQQTYLRTNAPSDACAVYRRSLTKNVVLMDRRESPLRDGGGGLPTTCDDTGRCNCWPWRRPALLSRSRQPCFISGVVKEFITTELSNWRIMENLWFQQDDALSSPCLCVNYLTKHFQTGGFGAVLQPLAWPSASPDFGDT
jgi:hypothetical protein